MRKLKNSGVEWIGEIPEEWEVVRFKNLCELYTGNSIKDSEKDLYQDKYEARPYISTKDISLETNQANYNNGLYIKNDNNNFKIANKNSVLMCIEGGSAGKKKTKLSQSVTFVNKLCCFYSSDNSNDYLYYFLCSPNFENEFFNNMSGLIGGVSVSILKNLAYLKPAINQQTTIANYLDEKTQLIDKTIELTKEQINKLKEYKQSLITETVTKGLDKNVKMKDSGVEWIGEIPKHWSTNKIKNIFNLKGRIGWQGLNSKEYKDKGAYLITGTDFIDNVIDWNNCVRITMERYFEAPDIHIRENDLLITKDGTVGKVAIAQNCPEHVSLNSGVLLLRKYDDSVSLKYVLYILMSKQFWFWFNSNQSGNSTIIHLYQNKFKEFKFTIPSKLEQIKIAKFLDEKLNEINEMICKQEILIEKLEEYKKSLIYECVTGKKEII